MNIEQVYDNIDIAKQEDDNILNKQYDNTLLNSFIDSLPQKEEHIIKNENKLDNIESIIPLSPRKDEIQIPELKPEIESSPNKKDISEPTNNLLKEIKTTVEITDNKKQVEIQKQKPIHKTGEIKIIKHEDVNIKETIPSMKPQPVIENKPQPVIENEPQPVIENKPQPVIENKPQPVIENEPQPVIENKPQPVIESEKPLQEIIKVERNINDDDDDNQTVDDFFNDVSKMIEEKGEKVNKETKLYTLFDDAKDEEN